MYSDGEYVLDGTSENPGISTEEPLSEHRPLPKPGEKRTRQHMASDDEDETESFEKSTFSSNMPETKRRKPSPTHSGEQPFSSPSNDVQSNNVISPFLSSDLNNFSPTHQFNLPPSFDLSLNNPSSTQFLQNMRSGFESSDQYQPPGMESSDTYQTSEMESSERYQSSEIQSSDRYQPADNGSSDQYQPSAIEKSNAYQPPEMQSSFRYQPSEMQNSDRYQASGMESSDRYQGSSNSYQPPEMQSSDRYQPSEMQSSDRYQPVKPSDSYQPSEIEDAPPARDLLSEIPSSANDLLSETGNPNSTDDLLSKAPNPVSSIPSFANLSVPKKKKPSTKIKLKLPSLSRPSKPRPTRAAPPEKKKPAIPVLNILDAPPSTAASELTPPPERNLSLSVESAKQMIDPLALSSTNAQEEEIELSSNPPTPSKMSIPSLPASADFDMFPPVPSKLAIPDSIDFGMSTTMPDLEANDKQDDYSNFDNISEMPHLEPKSAVYDDDEDYVPPNDSEEEWLPLEEKRATPEPMASSPPPHSESRDVYLNASAPIPMPIQIDIADENKINSQLSDLRSRLFTTEQAIEGLKRRAAEAYQELQETKVTLTNTERATITFLQRTVFSSNGSANSWRNSDDSSIDLTETSFIG